MNLLKNVNQILLENKLLELQKMNKKILLVGAGPMAVEYAKVLNALTIDYDVIGRGEASAKFFFEKTNKKVITQNIDEYYVSENYDAAIVAVSMEQLTNATIKLLENNFKKILVEKPAGMKSSEIQQVASLAKEKNADVLIAYNRRFYASTLAAEKMMKEDGGPTSMHFEFTEWSHVIEPLQKAKGVKENWFFGNSTHVVDLAFALGGMPKEMTSYKNGLISWHPNGAAFAGAGITDKNVLFSYNANWNAPGRWSVEWLTNKHRFILKPLEKLQVQKLGSVAVEEVAIDDKLDKDFKPGLFLQTQSFLQNDFTRFINIHQQAENALLYDKMMH